MHVIAVDRPSVNNHLVSRCRLTKQFSAPQPDVSTKYWVPIFGHPHHMLFAAPNRVAAALVRFHPTTLHWKCRDPSRLKAGGFLIPYRGL
jgi:hypothetical protein